MLVFFSKPSLNKVYKKNTLKQCFEDDRNGVVVNVLPRIAHDILYVLRIPGVASLLAASPAGLDEWLGLCGLMQVRV